MSQPPGRLETGSVPLADADALLATTTPLPGEHRKLSSHEHSSPEGCRPQALGSEYLSEAQLASSAQGISISRLVVERRAAERVEYALAVISEIDHRQGQARRL
jgi:hypothetical protein